MPAPSRPLPPVRRLTAEDAEAFQKLRLEGAARHPTQFRFALEDERLLTLDQVASRLNREYVIGGYQNGDLVAIGGLARLSGAKLKHKALLWGMYVRQESRGAGLGDAIVARLLAYAKSEGIEMVVLTLAADNERARRLYERWGFVLYGTEPRSVKNGDDYFDEALMAWQDSGGTSA